MQQESGKALGKYIKNHRIARGMTGRELARQIGTDTAYLVRLERGEYRSPRPDILAKAAEVLHVPMSDLYSMAGYIVPNDLPSLTPYLRTRYRQLSNDAIDSVSAYLKELAGREGVDLNGPAPQEDEPSDNDGRTAG